jgi:isocitrate dehydrogenase kinase/phosphatase
VGTNTYVNHGSLMLLFEDLLGDIRFSSQWRDLDKSIAHVAAEVSSALQTRGERREVEKVEVIRPVFYQISRAYIVGRIIGRRFVLPLVIALKNSDGGVLVDAVMVSEDDISIVFSFTRSYFHVDLERVAEAVVFLKSIMPRKPVSELFTVLGRAKQGKTERYRELIHHLEHTEDLFVQAPGERGLVMVCFTLPSFDVVFKVIRDRFAYPKTVIRDEVLAKYRLVFIHDRAGRLVDAQEFRRLRFPRARFSAELLEELERETGQTVHGDGPDLVFDHMYIERRMTPLNLYLRSAPPAAAEQAVLDYGQCIRDLAYTNIFPGDLLLKNFGVTRHGRVIFYDYDELCQVTDCTFRDLPQATNEEDEMRGEAWFYVGENDVFPETFIRFLAFDDAQRAALLRLHGEILTAAFWRGVQQRLREGEFVEVLPYHPHRVRVASSL